MRRGLRNLLLAATFAVGGSAVTASPAAAAPVTVAVAVRVAVAPTVLYGLDPATATVQKFTGTSTGPWTRVTIGRGLSDVRALSVDPAGNVYLINNHKLVRISAAGVQRNIAVNLTGLSTMTVDSRGTVFVADLRRVIRIWQPSGKQTVLGSIPADYIEGVGVDSAGRATVAHPGSAPAGSMVPLELTTFLANGGPSRTRAIINVADSIGNTGGLVETADGTVYADNYSTGGSGAHDVVRVNPGSTLAVYQETRLSDYAWTVDAKAQLHLMQNRKWCVAPSRGDGCVDDPAVDEILVFPAVGGTPHRIPTTNVNLPAGGIAVAADQTTYAASASALLRVPTGGGAAQPVVTGAYSLLTVRPGT